MQGGCLYEMTARLTKELKQYHLSPSLYKWFINFVPPLYHRYDKSHGNGHICDVLRYSTYFLPKGELGSELLAVIIGIHDALDQKYIAQWHRGPETERFIRDELLRVFADEKTVDGIFAVVANMSFSAELAGKNKRLDGEWESLRLLAQLGDWFTSVGPRGIEKAIQYNMAKTPDASVGEIADEIRALFNIRLKHYLLMVENMTGGADGVDTTGVIASFQGAHDDMVEIVTGPNWEQHVANVMREESMTCRMTSSYGQCGKKGIARCYICEIPVCNECSVRYDAGPGRREKYICANKHTGQNSSRK